MSSVGQISSGEAGSSGDKHIHRSAPVRLQGAAKTDWDPSEIGGGGGLKHGPHRNDVLLCLLSTFPDRAKSPGQRQMNSGLYCLGFVHKPPRSGSEFSQGGSNCHSAINININ